MTWPPASKIGWAALALSAAFLLSAPLPTSAQETYASSSPTLQDCLDHVVDNEHGSRWPAVTNCYQDELASQDRRLTEAWQALDKAAQRLAPRALGEIAAGRKGWEGYRESWCAFEQERFIKPNADVALLACRVDVTRAQLARVNEQIAVLR